MIHPTLRKGIISSPYGWRSFGFHGGIDFAGLPVGTPIYASFGGKVTAGNKGCPEGYYGSPCGNGGGNWLEITTNNNLKTRYMHFVSLAVPIGSTVRAGQLIGFLGNSGSSTAAHLHFEIWANGKQVDPAPYLQNASASPSAGSNFLLKMLLFGGLAFYILYEN